jgi:hypothetical protein
MMHKLLFYDPTSDDAFLAAALLVHEFLNPWRDIKTVCRELLLLLLPLSNFFLLSPSLSLSLLQTQTHTHLHTYFYLHTHTHKTHIIHFPSYTHTHLQTHAHTSTHTYTGEWGVGGEEEEV